MQPKAITFSLMGTCESSSSVIRIFDLKGASKIVREFSPSTTATCVVYDRKEEHAIGATAGGTIHLWNIKSRERVKDYALDDKCYINHISLSKQVIDSFV
jgi:hypothetical protein